MEGELIHIHDWRCYATKITLTVATVAMIAYFVFNAIDLWKPSGSTTIAP